MTTRFKDAEFGAPLERAAYVAVIASIVLFAAAASWANAQNLDIGLVPARSVDEFAFTFVVSKMYGGLTAFNPHDIFNILYFNYGFPYFFLQVVLTIPAQAMHDFGAVLFIERSFSLAWSLGTLALAGWWIARRAGSWAAGLLAVWLMIAMPGFVHLATIMHPDSMMVFFLLAAFVAAAELEPGRPRNVFIVGLLCGLGACAKIQIAIYVPFVAAIVALRLVLEQRGGPRERWWRAIGAGCAVGALTPLVYFVCNPFLAYGGAFKGFMIVTRGNILSNATNHFTYALPSAADKLDMLAHSYLPPALVALILIAVCAGLIWRKHPAAAIVPELAMLAGGVVTAAYIFVTVQKTWDSYYLPSVTLLVVSLVSLAAIAAPRMAAAQAGFAAVLVAVLILVAVRTPTAIAAPVVDDGPGRRFSQAIVSTLARVHGHVADMAPLINPYTPFQFEKLGLRLTQIDVLWGTLDTAALATRNVLVMRKDGAYFDPQALALENPRGLSLRQTRARLDAMRAGKDGTFFLCGENHVVLVFCRRSVYVAARP